MNILFIVQIVGLIGAFGLGWELSKKVQAKYIRSLEEVHDLYLSTMDRRQPK